MAEETAILRPTVQSILIAFGLQPHRQRHFKISNDPFFVEKVRDIIGLHLNPPDESKVLFIDEKSQVQALDRMQPLLPMDLGYTWKELLMIIPATEHTPMRKRMVRDGRGASRLVPRMPPLRRSRRYDA